MQTQPKLHPSVGAQIMGDKPGTMPPIARETRAPTNASYLKCKPNQNDTPLWEPRFWAT